MPPTSTISLISLALSPASRNAVTTDYKIPKDLFENGFGVPAYNERASDDLPLDSRGGGSFKFYAPYDATYTIQVFLNANITDTTELNMANFQDLYSGIIKDRGSSALWFYPAAVSHHLSFWDSLSLTIFHSSRVQLFLH